MILITFLILAFSFAGAYADCFNQGDTSCCFCLGTWTCGIDACPLVSTTTTFQPTKVTVTTTTTRVTTTIITTTEPSGNATYHNNADSWWAILLYTLTGSSTIGGVIVCVLRTIAKRNLRRIRATIRAYGMDDDTGEQVIFSVLDIAQQYGTNSVAETVV